MKCLCTQLQSDIDTSLTEIDFIGFFKINGRFSEINITDSRFTCSALLHSVCVNGVNIDENL